MELFNRKITDIEKKVIQRILSIIIGIGITILIFKMTPSIVLLVIPILSFTLYQSIYLINGVFNDSKWNAITLTIFFSGFLGFPAHIELIEKTIHFTSLLTYFGLFSFSICLLILLMIKFFYFKDLFKYKRHYVYRVLFGIPLFTIVVALNLNNAFASKKIPEKNIEIVYLNKEVNKDDALEYSVYIKFRKEIQEIKISKEQFNNLTKDDLLKVNYKKGYLGFYIIEGVEK
jgi:hypothetical protein